MATKTEVVKQVIHRLYCDKCGKEMRHSLMLLTSPPQFKHECECGHMEILPDAYPSIQHIDSAGNPVEWE